MKQQLGIIIGLLLLSSCASKQISNFREPPVLSELNNGGATPLSLGSNPVYPMAAISNNVEGWVLLEFDLNNNGSPINIEVLDSYPKDTFTESAINAIAQWIFEDVGSIDNSLRKQYIMEFKLAD